MPDDKPIRKKWFELLKPISGLEAGKLKEFEVLRETIPIIFVPGIMGTRLRRSAGKREKVWDPDAKGFMFVKYGNVFVGPAGKKSRLVGTSFKPDFLEPFNDDPKHNNDYLDSHPGAARRGWGGVVWDSYGEILVKLHDENSWNSPIKNFFRLPTYACGYNWTASNFSGARLLKKCIEDVIAENNRPPNYCEHVILITHSMGGLVARAACIGEGMSSKVLGIIHGVQPVTGAPAAYWRMKAGFERTSLRGTPVAWVLGTHGAEVTAILGHMPGGLQLLPSKDYQTNSGSARWLRLVDNAGLEAAGLPKDDPYSEIYLNDDPRDFSRLIHKPFLFPESREKAGIEGSWRQYKRHLEEAKEFHETIGSAHHQETQVFHGVGNEHPTPDEVVLRVSPYGWKEVSGRMMQMALRGGLATIGFGAPGLVGYFGYQMLTHAEFWQRRGGYKARVVTKEGVAVEVELQPAAGGGDGTVPESSGRAINQTGKAATGQDSEPFSGIEHEPAYHERTLTTVRSSSPRRVLRGCVG